MRETDAARIAKGSAYIVVQSIISTILSAVAFAFIARILTQTEVGIIAALLLTVGVAQLLSDLGFSSGLAKYIAEYRGRNADYKPILFTGVLIKTLTAGFLAVICAIGSQQLSQLLLKSDEYTILFQLLSVDLLFACINGTMSNVLLGLNKIRDRAILNLVSAFVRQAAAIALLISGYGLTGLVIGWILGESTYTILSALILAKGKHVRAHSTEKVAAGLKMLAKFSWPLFSANVFTFLYRWFDRVLLLAYIPLSQVGVYSVAYQAFTVLSIIPLALGAALLPYYSEQYGADKHENIMIGVEAAVRYITLLYIPLALGLMVTANPVITLFGGPAYSSGDVVLAILTLFGGISCISAALGVLLLVYNMTPTILIINVVAVGASIAASPILLPLLGIAGMAVLKGVAMIITLVLGIIAIRTRIRIKFDKEVMWKSWIAAIVMLVAVSFAEQMYFSHYLLPAYISVGGMIYALALRILKAVNANDIQLLRNLLGKRANIITNIIEKILI